MAAAAGREKESKFQIADPALRASLLAVEELGTGFTLHSLDPVDLVDIYYDTPDYRLLRTGLTLRLRKHPDQTFLGLKSLADAPSGIVHDRLEIEAPLGAVDHLPLADDWPHEVLQQVREVNAKPRDLAAIAVLHQIRHKRNVSNAETPDRAVAELSIDRVRIHGPDSPPAASLSAPPVAELDELELELLASDAAQSLDHLGRMLMDKYNLAPVAASKLERALLVLSTHPPGGPQGQTGIGLDMHIAEACRLIWREQLIKMLLCEHGVRNGEDPEYVHEMRVAIRRARAAGKLLGEFFRPKWVRPLLRGLRKAGKALGAVRDLDVTLENLARFRRRLPKADRKHGKRLIEEVQKHRAEARTDLLAYLDSREYAKFVVEFDRFCRTPDAGVRHDEDEGPQIVPVQVRHTLPSIILAHFERVRAYEVLFEAAAACQDVVPLPALHALRIECKYLRYSLEFVRHLLGDDGAALVERLKAMQDHLGMLNDAAVERERLLEWAGDAALSAAVVARLADLDQTIEATRAKVPARFGEFVAPENRSQLAVAIARL